MLRRPVVVIGLLGASLDRGRDSERWNLWRPSVDLCRHDDLIVDRFELLHASRERALAEVVTADIGTVSPETAVHTHEIDFGDPWDFGQVYETLHEFAEVSVRCRA